MSRSAIARTHAIIIVVVILVAGIGAALGFFSSTQPTSKRISSTSEAKPSATYSPTPVKLVVGSSFTIAGYQEVPLVAIDKGYFAQEGLDVSYVPTSGSGDLLSKMLVGQIDIGWLGVSTAILAIEKQSTPLEFIGMPFQRHPAVIVAVTGQGIASPKDLPGKTLATVAGAEETLLLQGYLKCEGIDPSSVHLNYVAPNVKFSLVTKNPITAFQTDLPVIEQFAAADGKNVTANLPYTDCLKGLYGNGWAVFKNMVQSRPDVLRHFMTAMSKAFEFTYLHPMEAAEIGAKFYPALGGAALTTNERRIHLFISQLAVSSDVQTHGWMWMTEENWNTTISLINTYMGPVNSTARPSGVSTNQFNPGIKPTDTNMISTVKGTRSYWISADRGDLSTLPSDLTTDFGLPFIAGALSLKAPMPIGREYAYQQTYL